MNEATHTNDDQPAAPHRLALRKLIGWAGAAIILAALIGSPAMLVLRHAATQRLEEPPSSVKTPNPQKAPWYFLTPMEMMVYFDPYLAGVFPFWLAFSCLIGGALIVVSLVSLREFKASLRLRDRAVIVLVFLAWSSLPLFIH